MSSDFVRYTLEIKTIDPDVDEYMSRIIAFWEKERASLVALVELVDG